MKHVKISILGACLLVFFVLVLREFSPASREVLPPGIAHRIENSFLGNLKKLSPEKQGHFLLRLYRISGDRAYLPEIKNYAERLSSHLTIHARNLDQPGYAEQAAQKLSRLAASPLAKNVHRARERSRRPEMALAHRLLFLSFQMKSFGLEKGRLRPDFDKVMAYLAGLSWEDYLFDASMIRYDAARLANMVYYLKFLGIADYENRFTDRFKEVFFSEPDARMDKTAYLNKVYGLTHLVIAASDYYQRSVPREKFAWVFAYFEKNLEALLLRNTPDTAAEIAVCFRLGGLHEHPAVKQVQAYLLARFDPKRGYLPLERKKYGWGDIEHRNILAILALADWQKLYPGPDLSA